MLEKRPPDPAAATARARPSWHLSTWPVDVRWTVAVIMGVAILGGLATDVGPWYFSLRQPDWKPPDWAFGPVWTLIYITTGWAGVRTWRRLPAGPDRSWFILACSINAMLNVLWSVLYFSWRRPDWALWEAAALWLSAAWVSMLMLRADRLSFGLMLPHLLWLAVAWALNWSAVELNASFGP